MTLAWHAVHVRTRQEGSVTRGLERSGLETFLPTCRVRRVWSDRIRTQDLALFPGYVFVHVHLGPRELLRIRKVRGVVDVVGLRGGRASHVPDDVVTALRTMVELRRDLAVVDTLPAGTDVLIGRGPLTGVRGRVCGRANDILAVEVALLGRVVTCSLNAEDVVPAHPRGPMQPSV